MRTKNVIEETMEKVRKKEDKPLRYVRTPIRISGSKSLYINIPSEIIKDLDIDRDTPIVIHVAGRSIIMTPISEGRGQ